MEQKLGEITHIGRILDPRYPTNLAIIIWGIIVAVLAFIRVLTINGDLVSAFGVGMMTSINVAVTWVLAREIDPDEPLAAFIPPFIMTVLIFLFNVPVQMDWTFLILVFVLMNGIRIINRSTGKMAKFTDSLVVFIMNVFIAFIMNWLYAIIGIFAFFFDMLLPESNRKAIVFAILLGIALGVAFVLQTGQLQPIFPSIPYIIGIVVVTFIYVPLLLKSRHVRSVGDITGETLIPLRVQGGQVFLLLVGYMISIWQGNTGVMLTLTIWVTIAGVSLFPLIKPFLPGQKL